MQGGRLIDLNRDAGFRAPRVMPLSGATAPVPRHSLTLAALPINIEVVQVKGVSEGFQDDHDGCVEGRGRGGGGSRLPRHPQK
eukprot:16446364-Heterocapsa_arctica.AAC.1